MMRHSATLLLLAALLGPALAASPLETGEAEVTVQPREHHLYGVVEVTSQSTISAQTSGQVMEILVDVDDYVEQGALIIRLKDTEQQARVEQAEAELKAADAQLEESSKEYQRTREIFERKLVAQAAMDKATAALRSARARKASATATLAQAREQLEYTRIRAPYSGIVTERLVEVGETASPGQRLISGISLEQLRVSVQVPQSLVPAIRKRSEAEIQLPDGRRIASESLTIFPLADPRSGTLTVRLLLPAGIEGLFPGMLVKTRFEIGTGQQLTVPASSVVYRSEVTAVYVIDQAGGISLRHIQAGQKRNGDRITVLSGLDAGEQVALDPVAAGSQLKALNQGSRDE
ncbi:MAG: efflux RND transporter periplasmic adaptor subunit [Sedimenticola sp.]|nr:efflux RND transporter periplasmic adaptor subunit [Sedimenticola sp.]